MTVDLRVWWCMAVGQARTRIVRIVRASDSSSRLPESGRIGNSVAGRGETVMTRYQLAKIVDWAGATLRSRKRMQKVAFLLQMKGCPIDADFFLHHYGPYSQDISRLTDEMVQAKMLEEQTEPNSAGLQYSYRVSDETRSRIVEFEAQPEGALQAKQLAPFEALARDLIHEDLAVLEVASTIVYFRTKQKCEWHEAEEKTSRFKGQKEGTPFFQKCLELAQKIID